ncbi:MAG: DUF4149 domain-containing protein [Pseudomonadota bacterium]
MFVTLALLSTAILLGGMVLYSFGFAALMFKLFDEGEARRALRHAFPPYYLFVVVAAAVAALLAVVDTRLPAILLFVICVTTIYARQVLMISINAATDRGDKGRFKLLHGASVVLQLVQIGLCGWALVLLAAL